MVHRAPVQRQQILAGENVAANVAKMDCGTAAGVLLVRLLTVQPLILLLVKGRVAVSVAADILAGAPRHLPVEAVHVLLVPLGTTLAEIKFVRLFFFCFRVVNLKLFDWIRITPAYKTWEIFSP